MKALVFLRTAIVVLAMAGAMLLALRMCLSQNAPVEYFHYSVYGVIALAVIAASKSAVEHIAAAFQGVTALGGLLGRAAPAPTVEQPK